MLRIRNRSGRFKMGPRLNTITNTTLSSPTYNGNGATTAFATSFQFLDNSDLQVVETSSTGVETVKTLTTHYTVTGAGNPSGGTVTMLVAPASGTKLNINSNVALDQQTDYQEGGSFSASTHERALDKLTKAVQQVKEITDRSIKLPVSNQSISAQTQPITADYVLGVNAGGTALEWKSPTTIAIGTTVTTFAETLLDDTTASETRTTLGLGPLATFNDADPNADRLVFWDDSAGAHTYLTPGTNLTITGTTINASGGASAGGSNTQVQFNSGGSFGGDSGFVYSGSGAAQLTGSLIVGGNSTASGYVELREDTDNGSNYIRIAAPSAVTSNTTITLPDGAGSAGNVLTTNGSGTLSWASGTNSVVLLQTNTSSSSAISEFHNLFSSNYDMYFFEFLDVLPATDNVLLQAQFGTGGTPTYITSGYKWASLAGEGSSSFQNTVNTSDTSIYFTPNGRTTTYVDNGAFGGVSGLIKIFGGDTTSRVTKGVGNLVWVGADASTPINAYPTFYVPANTITAVKFYFSSGNIASGKIRMYGVKNS